MKISLNWLKDYLCLDLSAKEVADKLTNLGLEATFISLGQSFEGVVLGKGVYLAKFINLYGCKIGDRSRIGAFVEIQKNSLLIK